MRRDKREFLFAETAAEKAYGQHAGAAPGMDIPDGIAHYQAITGFRPEAALALDEQIRLGLGIVNGAAIDHHRRIADAEGGQCAFDLGAFTRRCNTVGYLCVAQEPQ